MFERAWCRLKDWWYVLTWKVKRPNVLIWGRCTGKTTYCYKVLRKRRDVCMLTLNTMMAQHAPKDVRDRVFSYKSRKWIGKFRKVILDEADFMDEYDLYNIEALATIVLVVTSLGASYDNPDTWLRKYIRKHTWHRRPTPDYPADMQKWMPQSQFDKEFVVSFMDGDV